VDANTDEACDIPDRGHARVADGGIQPAQVGALSSPSTSWAASQLKLAGSSQWFLLKAFKSTQTACNK